MGAMNIKGWTVVFMGYRFQADVVAAALESHGLRVEVFGDHGFGPAISLSNNAQVLVPDDQAQAARQIVADAERTRSSEPKDV
jgi:Putative prokaryotic signal transducing protein